MVVTLKGVLRCWDPSDSPRPENFKSGCPFFLLITPSQVKAITKTTSRQEKTAMTHKFRIFALSTFVAISLSAGAHRASAASTSAPPPPPQPSYSITKYVDLASPKLCELVNILAPVLLP
jgi:hypothetical protein